MIKIIQVITINLCFLFSSWIQADTLNIKDLANSGKLNFSNIYLPNKNQFIQNLQRPCQQTKTKANHIGDYCAIWQLFTESIIKSAVNLNYQLSINYVALSEQLQLTLKSTDNKSDQVYLMVWLNNVSPMVVLSMINNLNSKPDFQAILNSLNAAEIGFIQSDIALCSSLPFTQLAKHVPVYRQAEQKLNHDGYPFELKLQLNYSGADQKLYFSTQGLSPDTVTLGIEFEGMVEQPVTIGQLERFAQFSITNNQVITPQQSMSLSIIPTYVGIEFAQQNLFYDIVSLALNHSDPFTLKLITAPLIQKQQQLAQTTQSSIGQNLHGSLAAFLAHPVSWRIAMLPQGQSIQKIWEAWSEIVDVLTLEQTLIENTFKLQAAKTLNEKKEIQRYLNKVYFQQQAAEGDALALLDDYFNVDFFVNGQPFTYKK